MFIDLTRLGGVKIIRVRVEAIAYLDDAPTGCNVALIGGETLRVNEDRSEVERRCGGDIPPPAAGFMMIDDARARITPAEPSAPQKRAARKPR